MQFKQSLAGLGDFALYFVLAAVFGAVFFYIYTKLTPHNEVKLIKSGNVSAALGLSGALIGYGLALASAISQSVGVLDFVLWALIALLVQVGAFFLLRQSLFSNISQRIENDEVSVGMLLAAISIFVGLINAACMTY